jgi:CBS domain-containing protein
MICPTCGWDNVPGNEACSHCQQALTPLDRPVAGCRVERSLMEDQVLVMRPATPITISPTATLAQAIRLMLDRNVGALLVVDDDGRLLGIFSERDLLKKIAGLTDDYAELPVSQFMTAKPETVGLTDTLNVVLNKMDGGGYRHVPVVDEGKPVNILSVRDMLRHITGMCNVQH